MSQMWTSSPGGTSLDKSWACLKIPRLATFFSLNYIFLNGREECRTMRNWVVRARGVLDQPEIQGIPIGVKGQKARVTGIKLWTESQENSERRIVPGSRTLLHCHGDCYWLWRLTVCWALSLLFVFLSLEALTAQQGAIYSVLDNLTQTDMFNQVALVVKNPLADPGNIRDSGSIPGSGRSPEEGNGNPLQYSCLENSMDRGVWWAPVHGGHKELDMTEVT